MKYRLIKKYPNSPELGFITDETMHFPASYPEFWEIIKRPLFTTEDKVDIYEGDKYFNVQFKNRTTGVVRLYEIFGPTEAEPLMEDESWSPICKFFSTAKAAEDWIELNEPKYSMQDILNARQSKCGNWTIIPTDDLALINLNKLKK
jgi:hypothetical protein